jgi:hypothetical protein
MRRARVATEVAKRKDQRTCWDHSQRNRVVELLEMEAGVAARVGWEIQTRHGMISKKPSECQTMSSENKRERQDGQKTDLCPVHPARFLPRSLLQAPPSVSTAEG